MNYEKLNNRIYDYVCNDKTHSAIMLNGDWGSGKSYYINYTLKPYLESKQKECYIISFYGLKDLSDISKLIYLEVKIDGFKKKRLKKFLDKLKKLDKFKLIDKFKLFDKFKCKYETKKATKIVAKTVISTIANRLNINLSQNTKDWQELYESIDLRDKLIVFDDIERSSIDIIEMLGYVNHLVEQDGAKVLLVTNEKELISEAVLKNEKIDDKKDNEESVVETSDGLKSYNYFKFKEKTVGDTIVFEPNIEETIDSILDMIDPEKKYLQKYKTEDLYDFYEMLYDESNKVFKHLEFQEKMNFRIFIFATQKFVDILKLECMNEYRHKEDFINTIYYSIISFSGIMKCNNEVNWDGSYESEYSLKFGRENYPLFKFCYDYIMYYTLPTKEIIDSSYNAYFRLKNFIQNKSKHDKDLIMLEMYRLQEEQQLRKVLENLKIKLESSLEISFFEYLKIAKILIELSKILEFDYYDYKQLMYNNLYAYRNNSDVKKIFQNEERIAKLVVKDENYEYLQEYFDFIEYLKSALGKLDENLEFPNDRSELSNYYNQICQNRSLLFGVDGFMSYVNIQNFMELLKKCVPQDINTIRFIFLAIYSPNTTINIDCCKKDLEKLKELKGMVADYLKEYNDDKIVKYQLKIFCNNLDEFIETGEKYIDL